MLPPASERVRRGMEPLKPIPEWVPWEHAPQADAARPMNLTGEAPTQEEQRPHVSLSDPLAEHTIYMQTAAQNRQAPLLDPDAAIPAPATPAESSAPVTPASAVTPAASTGADGGPAAPAPATKSPEKTTTTPASTKRPAARDKNKDIRPDFRAPVLPMDAIGRYAGAFAIVLVVAAALAYLGPNYSAIPLVIAQFVGALLLPVLRLVPWQDEDSGDVMIFILLTLMFGPLVSLVIYGVLGAFRQLNPAIAGCMTVAALTRLTVDFAARAYPPAQILAQTMPFNHQASLGFDLVKMLLRDWSGMLALAGWYTANIFHKFDE
jgi:hypothetical protein